MDLMQMRRKMLMQSVGGLPSAYQQVEWIETTGGQFLRTNYIPKRYDEVNCSFLTTKRDGGRQALFAAGDATYILILLITTNAAVDGAYYKYFASGDATKFAFYFNTHTVYDLSIKSNGEIECGGYSSISYYENDIDGRAPELRLFTRPGGAWAQSFFYGRLYNFKITNNNISKLDMIPCYRKSDGEIGMYDTVSKTFYTNVGTGTFLKGADV